MHRTSVSLVKLVLTVAALSVTMLVVGSVASADPATGSPCTLGEAKANFEAPLDHFVQDDPSVRTRCQYRVFFDGRGFTYCQDDVILGGVVWFENYEALGWTRKQAIAYYERYGEKVWIDGIEQPLVATKWKDGEHPMFGPVVYQQVGFVRTLPVGDHVSYYEETFDGLPSLSATVQLHVLPRTDAACS